MHNMMNVDRLTKWWDIKQWWIWNTKCSGHFWSIFNFTVFDIDATIIIVFLILASAQQLNMKGVFLHVLGDALGSVVVIISAAIYMIVPKLCPDPEHMVTTTVASMLSDAAENATSCVDDLKVPPQWVNYVDPSLRWVYYGFKSWHQCYT